MAEFHYSDPGEILTTQLIRSEYDPAYWGRSEDLVLRQAENYLKFRFGERLKEVHLLDKPVHRIHIASEVVLFGREIFR